MGAQSIDFSQYEEQPVSAEEQQRRKTSTHTGIDFGKYSDGAPSGQQTAASESGHVTGQEKPGFFSTVGKGIANFGHTLFDPPGTHMFEPDYGWAPGEIPPGGRGLKPGERGVEAHAIPSSQWEDVAESIPIVSPLMRIVRGGLSGNTLSAQKAGDDFSRGRISEGMAHTLATATPGGQIAESAGDAFGKGNIAEGLGDTALAFGPMVGSKLVSHGMSGAQRIANFAPLGDTVTRPRGTVSAEAASPLDLQAYAEQHGIPANAAQLTEHKFPRNLQSAGERASFGGTAVERQIKASQAALRGHVQGLMDQLSPNTPTTADAGAKLKSDIQGALEHEKNIAQQNYNAVDQQARAAGVTVNLKQLKQLADSMFHDSDFIRQNAKSMDPKSATAVLRDLIKLPDNVTFADVQKLRSKLLTEGLKPENAINDEVQGWIKRLTGGADDVMMDAAQKVPGLEQTFRGANAHWQQLQADFNSQRSPLAKAISEPDPVNVPQKFLQRGQTGGSPTTVRLLQRYGIDAGPLKRELLSDLADQKFKLQHERYPGGYDEDFLRTLFSPQELDHVQKTGALTRSVGLNTNTSGTAAVEQAAAEVRNPFKAAIHGAAARATSSPGFNRFLMREPIASPRAMDTTALSIGGTAINSASQHEQDLERLLMQRRRAGEIAGPGR